MKGNIRKIYDYYNKENKLEEMFKLIDFLLDDNKFECFDKNDKARLSKLINKYFDDNNIKYEYNLNINEISNKSRMHIRLSHGSQCELLFKGIRNGIVHLNFKIDTMTINNKKYKCINIKDKSAMIKIPIYTINDLYNRYIKAKHNN